MKWKQRLLVHDCLNSSSQDEILDLRLGFNKLKSDDFAVTLLEC